jgi:hypothetical protein
MSPKFISLVVATLEGYGDKPIQWLHHLGVDVEGLCADAPNDLMLEHSLGSPRYCMHHVIKVYCYI